MTDGKVQQSEPLSKKIVRGGIWLLALRITSRGLGFIRTIILARLLAPSDFGLLGIAMLAIATLETFSQTGFQAALIQKKDNVESYLDTAWTVSAIRGIVLFLILFFCAPVVAKFFNSPQATLVIKVIAVSTLLSGFRNIGILFFQKELEFNKQFFYELSATLVDLTVAITLAFMLRNVWALVWGGLAANFVRLFMSYIIQPYRPRIRFEKEKFQELFSFGRWVLGSSILIFLITQGDDIFVGKMLGVTALGFYQMAYLISNLPATEITHVISQVTFPAYSRLQYDLQRLRAAYLDTLQLTAFISIPIAGGIFILAPEFTEIFLGDKWMPMVPAMQVLCIFGATRSFGATTGPLFHGVGKPKTLTNLAILQLLILSVIIYPLTKQWGLIGISVAVVIPNIITQLVAACQIIHITEAKVLNFSKSLFFPFIGTFVMILAVLFFKDFSGICLSGFLTHVFIGIITYLGIIYMLDLICGSYYKRMVLGLIRSLH
ncbi:MAG: lipopolysaccharide biosynthesis protein [Deltaproteobacteria bacterium]|nr:lipopolysaccharide biosynthesis protein [Deltaproteobacteria bacterium]